MNHLRGEIQVVFQDPFGSLSPRMSMAEIIGEGVRVHHKEPSSSKNVALIDKRIDEAIQEVGLDLSMRNRYPHEFSGCLLYTSPSPRDGLLSRMPSSA